MKTSAYLKTSKDTLSQECDALSSSDFDECSTSVQSVRISERSENILIFNKGKRKDLRRAFTFKESYNSNNKNLQVLNGGQNKAKLDQFKIKPLKKSGEDSKLSSCRLEDPTYKNTTFISRTEFSKILKIINKGWTSFPQFLHFNNNMPYARSDLRKIPSEMILTSLLKPAQESTVRDN
ncbi:unnamed protein product [Moneuplotes crassus]|uniref:Uncharacterized protein n=1 Tax=Euplotes crassus TaxID=5936 RepID=A0AAD1XY61_EUPCR|nr:unnamed protein product [Moneuplotes crassus]